MSNSKKQCGHKDEKDFCPNWVKAVTALQIAKQAAFPHIERQMKEFVLQLFSQHADHFEDLLCKITVGERTIEKKYKSKRDYEWVLKDTTCEQCVKLFECIRDEYNDDACLCKKKWKCHDLSRTVTVDSYWWILSKIYITDSCKVNNSLGPDEVDPLAIFSLMSSCKKYRDIKQSASVLIDLRHALMHSKDNTLSDKDMEEHFQLIENFLRIRMDDFPTFYKEFQSELDTLKHKEYFTNDPYRGWQVLVEEARMVQEMCLKTDYQSEIFSSHEQKIQDLENQIKRLEDELEQKEREIQDLDLERQIEELKDDFERKEKFYQRQIRDLDENKQHLNKQIKGLEDDLKQKEREIHNLERQLNTQKSERQTDDSSIVMAGVVNGATAGSILGPWGSVVGGAIGGLFASGKK